MQIKIKKGLNPGINQDDNNSKSKGETEDKEGEAEKDFDPIHKELCSMSEQELTNFVLEGL